ncbi:MAG: TlpA disulfide reductase family protein [Streptosporangiaceae bacterium]
MNPRVAVAVVAVLLTAGCGGTDKPDSTTKHFPAGERRQPVTAAGLGLDQEPLALKDLQGKVVVVNFWASWCSPCRAEAPAMEQLYGENKAKGVEFVGVDVKDTDAAAKAFVRTYQLTYPNLADPQGKITLDFRSVSPGAVPTTLILDRKGRIAVQHSGSINYTALAPLIARVVAEK